MDIPNSPNNRMIYGKLTLSDENSNLVFMATSGLPNYQFFGGWKTPRKGLLPPYDAYSISTQKLWLPNVKGVEGSFYAIAPFSLKVDGVTRGDLGVHFDANVPGTAGCIAIKQQDHWDMWRKKMQEYQTLRIKSVPLKVNYT